MYCSNCGKEIPDLAVFCPECGANQGDGLQATAGTKKKKKHRKVGMIAAVVVLLVVLVAAVKVGSFVIQNKGYDYEKRVTVYWIGQDKKIYDVKGNSFEMSSSVSEMILSGSGKQAAVLGTDNKLYIFSWENSVDPIFQTEDVDEMMLSYDGSVVAYSKITSTDEWGMILTNDLYIYNLKEKNHVKIAENIAGSKAQYSNHYTLALSPDGSCVAYGKYANEESSYNDMDLYVSNINGEKEQQIAKGGVYPVAVSSDGKYVYYEKNDKFYLHTPKEEKKLDSDVDQVRTIFNKDLTEVIFSVNDKTYWYSVKEDFPVKLVDSSLIKSNPAGLPNMAKVVPTDQGIYGVNTLDKMIFTTDQAIFQMDKKSKSATYMTENYYGKYEIWGNEWNYNYYVGMQTDEKEKQLLYIKNSKLYKKELTDKVKEECTSGELEVKSFVASKDLKKVYIITPDDELFYLKKGKPIQISYDISASYINKLPMVRTAGTSNDTFDNFTPNIHYSDELGGVFFVEDGDLYYAKTDSSSKTMIQEDIEGMIGSPDDVVLFFTKSSTEDGTLLFNRIEDLKNTITL